MKQAMKSSGPNPPKKLKINLSHKGRSRGGGTIFFPCSWRLLLIESLDKPCIKLQIEEEII